MASNLDNDMLDFLKKVKSSNKHDIEKPENDNMLNLAYIGDIIYDFYVSDNLIRKYNNKLKINDINKNIQKYLCAKGQARYIEKLIDDNVLTEEELEIYKHARNSKSCTRSKNSSVVDYRKATGFEALLGHLYYKNNIKRLIDILSYVKF